MSVKESPSDPSKPFKLGPETQLDRMEAMLGQILTRLEGITGLLGTAVSGNLPPSGASVLLQYPRDPEQEVKDQVAIDKVIAEWRQGQTEAPPLAD